MPGTASVVDFYEYRNVPRRTFHPGVYDSGAPALALRVNGLDAIVKRLKATGTPIVSAKGAIVQLTPASRNIVVTDPNGLNLELYERKH